MFEVTRRHSIFPKNDTAAIAHDYDKAIWLAGHGINNITKAVTATFNLSPSPTVFDGFRDASGIGSG